MGEQAVESKELQIREAKHLTVKTHIRVEVINNHTSSIYEDFLNAHEERYKKQTY